MVVSDGSTSLLIRFHHLLLVVVIIDCRPQRNVYVHTHKRLRDEKEEGAMMVSCSENGKDRKMPHPGYTPKKHKERCREKLKKA
jgi:hypothetical protein